MSARRGIAALALAAAAALAAIPVASGSSRPVTRTVKVRDYYLSPTKLTVPRKSTIVWRWPSVGGDSHNVALRARPRGVRRFESEIASDHYSFRRKLTVKGRYVVICTLHPTQMRQTIVVR